MNEVAQI